MKEFIEKLIGGLREQSAYSCGQCMDEAIEVVCKLAEEYNNGWIPCEVRLPEGDGKRYLVQQTNGIITDLRFAKDAYKVDKYDFAEYKGKKKALFYDYDSEYGFVEIECEAWMPLPAPYKKRGMSMTENEAINIIFAQEECEAREHHCDKDKCDECELFYMQGTVREHKKALQIAIQTLEEIQQYRAIGTVEEFKALKEKATPKKLEIEKFWGYDDLMCPNCKSYKIRNPKYCCDCGQKLDWQ